MGCSGSSSAAAPGNSNSSVWSELKQRLPLDKTPEQQKKRDILFAKFDETKKNSLTETECLAGCKKHLELEKLSKNLPAVNKRAFTAASGLRTRADATSGVDPAEFRLYLQYIRDYFELNVMFEEVDTSADRLVTLAEFKQALPRIEKWGLKVKDPEAEFKKVDKDGNGVTFDEFADWAIRHNLDAEKDASVGAIPPATKAEAAPAPAEEKKEKALPVAAAAASAAPIEEKKAEEKKAEEKKAEEPKAAPAPVEEKKEKALPVAAPVEEKKEAPAAAAATEATPVEEIKAEEPKAAEEKKAEEAPAVVEEKKETPDAASAPAAEEKKAEASAATATAPVTTASLSAAAAKRKNVWADIKTRLPRKKTPEQNAARDEIFTQFDPNGNGYLSYAEIERGCKAILKLDEFTDDLDPILIRAYNAARNARKGKGAESENQDAYVERVEFRLLLVYIYDYFELWMAFDEVDSSDDMKVTLAEFSTATPKFEKWGVKIADPAAEFATIDKNGSGSVTFPEFAEWAISKHLDADGEQNQQ